MPFKVTDGNATVIARDLTKIALEQKLIPHSSSSAKKSADNVVEYLNTIYDAIRVSNLD